MNSRDDIERLSKEDCILLFNELQLKIEELKNENEKLKSINNSLKTNNTQYKTYIENAPDGVFICNEKGEYIEVNPSASAITGYSTDELLKMSIANITPENQMDLALKHFQTLVQTGKSVGELKYIHKNKDIRWWYVNAIKLTETKYLGFIKDITDRKNTEIQLIESENKFKMIFDTLAEGVALNQIIYDNNGVMIDYKIIEVNDGFYNIASYNKNIEVIGSNATDLYSMPKDFITNFWKSHKKNTISVQNEYYDTVAQKYFIVSTSPFIKDKFVTSFYDITDRKKAEEKLKESELRLISAQAVAKVGSWEINLITSEVIWSDEIYKIFELDKHNFQQTYPNFLDYIHPDEKDKVEKTFLNSFESEIINNKKNRIITPFKNEKHIQVSWFINKDSNGKPFKAIGTCQDITESVLAEQKLKESETKFRNIIDLSPIPYALNDENMNITYLNPAFINSFGYTLEDIPTVSDWWPKAYPDSDYSNYLEKEWIDRIKNAKDNYSKFEPLEVNITCKDGSKRYAIVEAGSLNKNYNDILLVTLFDITERKKAELLLLETQEFNKQVIKDANEGVIVYDLDIKYKVWNPFMERLTGYTSDEVIGKHPFELFPFLQESGVNDTIRQALNGISSEAIDFYFEMPKSGKKGWASDKTSPLYNSNGEIIGVITTVRDITENKKYQNKLEENERFLTETQKIAKLGTYVVDILHGTWESSEILDKIFGIDENYDKSVEGWLDISHPEFRNEIHDYFINYVLKYRNEFNKEYKIINKKNNKEIWVHGLGKLIYDNDNNIISMVGTIRDITERKQNEENILLKNIELAETNASKDKFFSIIAHDLKSPFSGFLGLTKIMSEEMNTLSLNEINEISKAMQDSANNLYKLLENLLEWSRMQRGMIAYNPDDIVLKFIVSQNISLLSDFSNQKQIRVLNLMIESSKCYADISMLNTVLRNLISNAIKFTKKGGTIEIGVDKTYISNFETCIYVKDSGIGMDSELLNDLFKLDVNVSRQGTEGESSTGLGLLLCKEFINKNKGRIWVESKENIGSTFYFTLPNSILHS